MKAPTVELLKHFDALHRTRFDAPAVIVAGKDAKILARLWRSHEAYVRPMMARFFTERGQFQDRAGFTVGVFASQFARLLNDYQKWERKIARPEVGAWIDECRALHAGRCGNPHFHAAKIAEERGE